MERWLRNLDPKVWKPVVAGLVFVLVHFLVTGEFNRTELGELVLTGAYGLLGYAVPNSGSILRTPQEDGNAYPPGDPFTDESGYLLIGVLVLILVVILVYILVAAVASYTLALICAVVVLLLGLVGLARGGDPI